MNLIKTIILFVLINILTRFVLRSSENIIQIIKYKKAIRDYKKFNIDIPDDINKDFWEDLENEDISTGRNNE